MVIQNDELIYFEIMIETRQSGDDVNGGVKGGFLRYPDSKKTQVKKWCRIKFSFATISNNTAL